MADHNDLKVLVTISPDELKAFITLYAVEASAPASRDEIHSALANQQVTFGIKEEAINYFSENPVYKEAFCVAEGISAQNGKNGFVIYHFDTTVNKTPSLFEDGSINYRELNLIQSVKEGQILCTLEPPIMGTQGKSVKGKTLPAVNGRAAILPRGKNVAISEDGKSIYATTAGEVEYLEQSKVSVYTNHEIPADVDNSTGNVSFVGSVIIKGNVLSGFSVEAGGNVEVYGAVEGATIKAGGNIVLRRGMQGMGKGSLSAGGDIVARYIEYSNVEAKNNIQAEAVMHSNVRCGNKLELTGRKGLLVGGTCKVGKIIVAKIIGSHMATVTDLEVGADPTIRERYKKGKDDLVSMESDIKKANQAIVILKKIESMGALTPDKQEILTKSVRTKIYLSSKLEEVKKEMMILDEKLQQEGNGKIRALSFLYPGVKVSIGSCMMYVKETLQYCTLYREGADICVGAIDK
ncbi:MAG TPA: FapA family protein [Ruminiclostridium sp.]